MFGRKFPSPGYGFLSPGFYFICYFFGSLEREPSLWENTWPWEILRTWESFPGIPLGNQDLWGGEKESTFDTGRVETGTYHWEGRKPFIQTFERFLVILWFVHVYPGWNIPKNWDLMVVNLGWCITRGHLPHSAGLFHMAITHWFTSKSNHDVRRET